MSKTGKAHLNDLYKFPLPVPNVLPLPSLSLNPLAIAHYLYHYLLDAPPKTRFSGSLNSETKSVWVTDVDSVYALWFSGFFGKGQYSRSEPSWFIRTRRRLGLIGHNEALTAEEITSRRRTARTQMKAERAQREREELEATLKLEGRVIEHAPAIEQIIGQVPDCNNDGEHEEDGKIEEGMVGAIPDIEALQLTLHEALFLGVGLDVLDIYAPHSKVPISSAQLLALFTSTDTRHQLGSSPMLTSTIVSRESPFLLHYAVYHHYRSLGWTPKPGIKFGVDFLLYKRGPVFSHAEFSIVIVPSARGRSVSSSSSSQLQPQPQRQQSTESTKPWWWLHTLTRVNGQVKKTVILVFVEFDHGHIELTDKSTLQTVLADYRIREVSLRRWIPSRNRD